MEWSVRPHKKLSQNFLRDRSFAKRIVDCLDIKEKDFFVEIGPGEGALTKWLLESKARRIIGVEIDPRLSGHLKKQYGQDSRLGVLTGNFLDLDLSVLSHGYQKLRIVGNIPYSITTPILFKILDDRTRVRDLTVTVQKEVAERIVSTPGKKTYGIPSVLFQTFSRVEMLFLIPRNAFYPVPKVDSAVLQFIFYENPTYEIQNLQFFRLMLKTIFGQRRKMLRNTLKKLIQDETVLKSVLDVQRMRPEELSVEQLIRLSNTLSTRDDKNNL